LAGVDVNASLRVIEEDNDNDKEEVVVLWVELFSTMS